MKYNTELISKEVVAEGTMSFHFKKPEGFEWRAGQSMDVTLIDPPETDGNNTHAFSIVSAPHESELTIATRMRGSAYKKVLEGAKSGTEVEIEGPFGSFTLHENENRKAIMLVGGIGITPFVSMIKDAVHRNLPHTIYLFYSNRTPENTVFMNELKTLEEESEHFKCIFTMTNVDESKASWEGETGYITREMIERHVPDREGALYYSAGPQAMVGAMRSLLNEAGVSNDDIKTEEFSGY